MYLSFSFYHTNTNVNTNDRIQMQICVNNVWQNIGAPIPRYMANTNPIEYYDDIAHYPWKNHFTNLSSFTGQNVSMGFLAISEGGEALKIDDIQVFSNPEGIVLADDFNDNTINTGLYKTYQNTVTETGQTLQLTVTQTDHPGIIRSSYLAINSADSLIITRKVKVHYANEYYWGSIGISIDNVLPFSICYSNYSYVAQGTPFSSCSSYGIRICRNAESPAGYHNLQNLSNTVTCPWNTWFDEKIAYNFSTGMVSYYINGQFQLSMFVGISNSTEHFARFEASATGWWTGHYQYMDDLSIRAVLNIPKGSLTGVVSSSSGPIAGATLNIINTGLTQTTSSTGTYTFPTVPIGIKQVKCSKIGYVTQTQSATITENQTTTRNFSLIALPNYNVTGTVYGSGAPTVGLAGVTLRFVGDITYTVSTNAAGQYVVPVLGNTNYVYTITKVGYNNAIGNITVGTTNYAMSNVTLNEIASGTPVSSVTATLNTAFTQANIAWSNSDNTNVDTGLVVNGNFISGTNGWQIVNFTSGSSSEIVSEGGNNCMVLHHQNVNDWNSIGQEIRSRLIPGTTYWVSMKYKVNSIQENVTLSIRFADSQLVMHSSVVAPNLNESYVISDNSWHQIEGTFVCTSSFPLSSEPMLSVMFNYGTAGTAYIDNVTVREVTPRITEQNDMLIQGEDRSFTGYKLWRMLEGQEANETAWTLLTPNSVIDSTFADAGWASLPSGNYKWAVKSLYSGGILSLPTFSNVLDHVPPTGSISLTAPANGVWVSSTPYFDWFQQVSLAQQTWQLLWMEHI